MFIPLVISTEKHMYFTSMSDLLAVYLHMNTHVSFMSLKSNIGDKLFNHSKHVEIEIWEEITWEISEEINGEINGDYAIFVENGDN